ncbi:MAG: M23 family metallopeptidase, partial [Bryobacteraceae bacterium]|nr:M23 family metallopeptidase [Bryobacteraceae bacterium]
MRVAAWLPLWAALAAGAEIGRLETGTAPAEGRCALARRSSVFEAAEAQVYVQFLLKASAQGESVRVEWANPAGEVAESAEYVDLPAGRTVCVLNALQVGGFAPATQPGRWRVRVLSGGRLLGEREFEIRGRPARVAVRVAEAGEGGLVLDTWGAEQDATVNIARYRERGGWEYVAVMFPSRREGGRMWAQPGRLEPGEYLVILRNPDGAESLPARFVIRSPQGFRKPFPEGETWRMTQGPYGSFSHYGRAAHAWDFAPVQGRFVTAMRGGTVVARDLGLGQTPDRRLFGNYITIRHDDGTYSHYAHLKSGTFRVRTGQRVEAGQVLAEAGNSGYSFGRHVHVHVTRAPSISAPSVPFAFDEAEPARAVELSAAGGGGADPLRWEGEAGFSQWWSRLLKVPKGTRRLAVRLGWEDRGSEFDLYLVSPRGEWFR